MRMLTFSAFIDKMEGDNAEAAASLLLEPVTRHHRALLIQLQFIVTAQ